MTLLLKPWLLHMALVISLLTYSCDTAGRFAAGPPWLPEDLWEQTEGHCEMIRTEAFPGLGDRLVSFFYNCCRTGWDKPTRTRAKGWFAF